MKWFILYGKLTPGASEKESTSCNFAIPFVFTIAQSRKVKVLRNRNEQYIALNGSSASGFWMHYGRHINNQCN